MSAYKADGKTSSYAFNLYSINTQPWVLNIDLIFDRLVNKFFNRFILPFSN